MSGAGTVSANLVLSANTLVPGSSYTFSLSSIYLSDVGRVQDDASFISSSSITILVNTPPTGGIFEVSPEQGEQKMKA